MLATHQHYQIPVRTPDTQPSHSKADLRSTDPALPHHDEPFGIVHHGELSYRQAANYGHAEGWLVVLQGQPAL